MKEMSVTVTKICNAGIYEDLVTVEVANAHGKDTKVWIVPVSAEEMGRRITAIKQGAINPPFYGGGNDGYLPPYLETIVKMQMAILQDIRRSE